MAGLRGLHLRRSTFALLVLAAAALVAPGTATASCVGPQLRVAGVAGEGPSTVWIGEPTQVQGSYFVEGCNDAQGTAVGGCAAHTERESVRVMKQVTLVLRQRHHEWTLAEADADQRGRIVWSATVPRGLRTGPATLIAGPARLRIAIGSHGRG